MEAVLSVFSVPGTSCSYEITLEVTEQQEGGRSEMAASLLGREPGSRGTCTVGSRYQVTENFF
jgi:hypothetical protein